METDESWLLIAADVTEGHSDENEGTWQRSIQASFVIFFFTVFGIIYVSRHTDMTHWH